MLVGVNRTMSAVVDNEKQEEPATAVVEVLVRFKTRYEQYRVTEESIAIPTRLKRFGLSDIINHLLQLPRAVPFDFVLNQQLLRGSLGRSFQTRHDGVRWVTLRTHIILAGVRVCGGCELISWSGEW